MKYDYYSDCYFSMGDFDAVAEQIRLRSRLDPGYQTIDGMEAEDFGTFDINENLICAYADLDALIDTCGMTGNQRRVVDMQMDGHSLSEIARRTQRNFGSIREQFERAIRQITARNDAIWNNVCEKRRVGYRPIHQETVVKSVQTVESPQTRSQNPGFDHLSFD